VRGRFKGLVGCKALEFATFLAGFEGLPVTSAGPAAAAAIPLRVVRGMALIRSCQVDN
jgi:hypothetical protein